MILLRALNHCKLFNKRRFGRTEIVLLLAEKSYSENRWYAMLLSLKYIQSSFVDSLAKEYQKWANDAEYRDYRESLSLSKKEAQEKSTIVA